MPKVRHADDERRRRAVLVRGMLVQEGRESPMRKITITVPDDAFEALEKRRGKVKRATYVSDLIKADSGAAVFPVLVRSKDELLDLAREVQATESDLT